MDEQLTDKIIAKASKFRCLQRNFTSFYLVGFREYLRSLEPEQSKQDCTHKKRVKKSEKKEV